MDEIQELKKDHANQRAAIEKDIQDKLNKAKATIQNEDILTKETEWILASGTVSLRMLESSQAIEMQVAMSLVKN